MRPLLATLLALAAIAPAHPVAADSERVLGLSEITRAWTPFGLFGHWAVYHSPAGTDRTALTETGDSPPLAVAFSGSPLTGLGAYVECRPWVCGTSLWLGVLIGHDVHRSTGRYGRQVSRDTTRVLLEPDKGFSQESDARVAVADQGYPLQLSLLLSILLPDGSPFTRAMKESRFLLPSQTLADMRRSSVLRVQVRHADGTSRTHEMSLWGFSAALDVLELKCRHEAETLPEEIERACRGDLELERRW